MTRSVLAEYSDDRRELSVAEPRHGRGYQLTIETSDGLEAMIPFDAVDVGRNTVTLYQNRPTGARVESASVERRLDAWGSVGEWLREHAAAQRA